MHQYYNSTTGGPPTFYIENMGRADACAYFHVRMVDFDKRNYQNSTTIPNQTWNDPLKDPEEHWARLNHLGDIHRIYTYRSWDNYNYIKSLGKYMSDWGFNYFIISAIASAFFFFCVTIGLIWKIIQLREYYILLFHLSEAG